MAGPIIVAELQARAVIRCVHFEEVYSAMSKSDLDIAALTPQERLSLLEQLWDSLAATPEAIPLTEAQREELDRRLDDLEADGPVGIPWDEVLSRIRSRAR
jgi:putative addiction module component (TIGR02574 family)